MSDFFLAEARDKEDNFWIQVCTADHDAELREEAKSFARGILRPRGTKLTVTVYGPFSTHDRTPIQTFEV